MLLCVSDVFGLSSDNTKPVHITADYGAANQKTLMTTLTGDITITRGSIVVHAKDGTVKQDANGDKIITLYGSPIDFSQKQDDGYLINGQSNKFEYNTKTNIAILSNRAKIKKNDDEISGETITYNTKTQVYNANGIPSNGIYKKNKSGKIIIILNDIQNEPKHNKPNIAKPN